MNTIERLRINPEDPSIQQMLARQAMEAIRAEVYISYLHAVDQYHGGCDTNHPAAIELQNEKSAFARSEYPLIPYFWLLHNDDGSIFQEMLELNKIDPNTAEHPLITHRTHLNGLHITDGKLLVAIFNNTSEEVWRNAHFTHKQSSLLFGHAREIEAIARD